MPDRAALEARLEAALARADEREPEIAALLDEPDRRGRIRAAIDGLYARFPDPAARPPLFGTFLGVKDIFHVDGLPTRAGSALPAETLAGPEATSVRQLRDAGAIVFAKTVTTEFAYFAPGPTRNPRRPEHTPGGSSSGSAAGVAAGYFPVALGTQTIGSINRPAAYCGIFGFKPSRERIDRAGVIPLSTTLDHVGLFAAGLEDLRRAARVLLDRPRTTEAAAVPAPALPASPIPTRPLPTRPLPTRPLPTLGLPTGPYLDRATDVALDHLERATRALVAAGFEVRPLELLPDFDEVESRHRAIVAREAADTHATWFERWADRYHPKTRELIELGRGIDDAHYRAAIEGRDRLSREIDERMLGAGIDLWITPSAPGPAPRGLESTGDPVMNLPWTQAGLPTLTLPAGETEVGLPMGLQLVGRAGGDESLFTHAQSIAEALADTPTLGPATVA